MTTLREILINTIIEYAGDEFEQRDTLIQLAKESEDGLIENIHRICEYYFVEDNKSKLTSILNTLYLIEDRTEYKNKIIGNLINEIQQIIR